MSLNDERQTGLALSDLQAELAWVAEIAVGEAIKEAKRCQPVKARWNAGNADAADVPASGNSPDGLRGFIVQASFDAQGSLGVGLNLCQPLHNLVE